MQVVNGTVSRLSDDGAQATVAVERAVGCRRCAEGRGCGAGIFDTRGRLELTVALPLAGPRPGIGDVVKLQLAPSQLLEAAATAYGIPLALAALFALVADAYTASDFAAALAAMAGLGVGFCLSRFRLRRRGCVERLSPVVLPSAARRP